MSDTDNDHLSSRAVIELIDRINAMNRVLMMEITNTHRSLTAEIAQTNQNVALLVSDIKDLARDIHGAIQHADEVRHALSDLDGRVDSLEMRIMTEAEHRDVRIMVDEWKNRRWVMSQVQAQTEGSVLDRRLTLISIAVGMILATAAVLAYVHPL